MALVLTIHPPHSPISDTCPRAMCRSTTNGQARPLEPEYEQEQAMIMFPGNLSNRLLPLLASALCSASAVEHAKRLVVRARIDYMVYGLYGILKPDRKSLDLVRIKEEAVSVGWKTKCHFVMLRRSA